MLICSSSLLFWLDYCKIFSPFFCLVCWVLITAKLLSLCFMFKLDQSLSATSRRASNRSRMQVPRWACQSAQDLHRSLVPDKRFKQMWNMPVSILEFIIFFCQGRTELIMLTFSLGKWLQMSLLQMPNQVYVFARCVLFLWSLPTFEPKLWY